MSKRPHIHSAGLAGHAAVTALALALCACGGGGGGGYVASTPPPPASGGQSPPPTSGGQTQPPATPATIAAPARATTPPGAVAVVASDDGPNFTTGPTEGTVFPLLQTALAFEPSSVKPATSVNLAGGTASVEGGDLSIDIAGDDDMRYAAASNLDWTRAGWWGEGSFAETTPSYGGVFVAGYETPSGSMPTTGSATYTGTARGFVIFPFGPNTIGGFPCKCHQEGLEGKATLTVDFGARTLSGSLTDMLAGAYDDPWEGSFAGEPWNNVTFAATVTGNGFSGTSAVTNAPGGFFSMSGSAAGTIEGKFFGPSAQEAGAVWTLFDGTRAAIGTLSGKRP